MRLNINQNCAASLALNGQTAEMVSKLQARISKGSEFLKAQALLTKFRFVGQFNRILSNSGFFTSNDAVLHTITSAVVGGVEQSDVMQSCECRGRGAKSQIAPNDRVKGFICVVTGLRRRAVADADSSDRSVNRIAGTGCRTGVQVGYKPKPLLMVSLRLNKGEQNAKR